MSVTPIRAEDRPNRFRALHEAAKAAKEAAKAAERQHMGDYNAARWAQAELLSDWNAEGVSNREIARQITRSEAHVRYMVKTWREHHESRYDDDGSLVPFDPLYQAVKRPKRGRAVYKPERALRLLDEAILNAVEQCDLAPFEEDRAALARAAAQALRMFVPTLDGIATEAGDRVASARAEFLERANGETWSEYAPRHMPADFGEDRAAS